MNFALSQQRADRHPVGLLIVVGLHVLLAGALLSARLASNRPADAPPVVLTPLDPVKPIERSKVELPKPPQPVIHTQIIPPPVVTTEPPPPDTIGVSVEPQPRPEVVASVGTGIGNRDLPTRVTPRAARIDAGASRCRPEYPAVAQRAGATGTTLIRFSVDATGRISGSQILQSSGSSRENRLMDKAAAEALAQCPVQVGTDEMGRPVGTTTDVQYIWSLN